MSQKLSEKVALITGGTSGIDLATAKRFVAEGAYVFITGVTNGNSYMSGVASYALKPRKKAKAT